MIWASCVAAQCRFPQLKDGGKTSHLKGQRSERNEVGEDKVFSIIQTRESTKPTVNTLNFGDHFRWSPPLPNKNLRVRRMNTRPRSSVAKPGKGTKGSRSIYAAHLPPAIFPSSYMRAGGRRYVTQEHPPICEGVRPFLASL